MRLIDIAPCEHHGHAMVLFVTEDGKLCQCRSCDILTIEAEPAKHGRWLQPKSGECFCSECKTLGSPQWKRCPVCEAKMNGGDAG